MIRDALVMLGQEPWCYLPEQTGKLTDWQIENLYAKPAAERAEKIRRSGPGEAGPPRRAGNEIPHEPGTDGHRAMVVAGMMAGPFAMSREAAEKSYDQQLAAYRAGK